MTTRSHLCFNQLNIVSGDPEASLRFYCKLGVEIPDNAIWKTQSGIHHATAQSLQSLSETTRADLNIDSTAFGGEWNGGWRGRKDLAGRVVIGFQVPSREEVDALYGEMTAAGI